MFCFAQPKGGELILNITYQGETIQFNTSRDIYNSRLLSSDETFELVYVSGLKSNSMSCLNYSPRMEFMSKSILWKDNYHLKIIHSQTDTMNIYIDNIIEGHYYLKIPFRPNDYKLLYIDDPNETINGKSQFLSAKEKYPLVWTTTKAF